MSLSTRIEHNEAATWLHAHLTANLNMKGRVDPPIVTAYLSREGMAWLLSMLAHLVGIHSTIRASEGADFTNVCIELIRLCDVRDAVRD